VTITGHKAIIDFGQAKTNLFINLYNWRVSYPDEIIYLALADIPACFRFPRTSANVTGAFGFMAEGYYFLSTSHVFGSNTSESSWEPLWQAIQSMIPIYLQLDNLVAKHKTLLNTLKWEVPASDNVRPVRAFKCKLNKGILDDDPLTANIYVDDILAAAAFKERMIRLLVLEANIEAIFLVCGIPDTSARQCPLSLEKWDELTVGPRQIVLGLVVDTNSMMVGITPEYNRQVRDLLNNWDSNACTFRVNDMQKLLGKLARLGKGTPLIFKLMSHLCTSLAYSLKNDKQLLEECSSEFKDLVKQIERKSFICKLSNLQRHINFAMKHAARKVNRHYQLYPVNQTMREELSFIASALNPDSGIKFETSITHLIPKTPTASIIGDSSLFTCGGYLVTLNFWWHLTFPKEIVERNLLHLKDNLDKNFISINCLEYVTIIIDYCPALTSLASNKFNDDPHPVNLCVTNNTSTLNWTLHTSKKLAIGRALARFFCGLLIGSDVGINAKWISKIKNVIANKISRLKATHTASPNSPSYDYSNIKQDHNELEACSFFQPSPKLLSFLWEILLTILTKKCPNLSQILKLRPPNLGRLHT
jgi:hypothetical protein